MPLITLKHTRNLLLQQAENLCVRIHESLVTHCGAKIESCKSLIVPFDQYVIGDNQNPYAGFLHLRIGLLPGRTIEQKNKAAQEIMRLVQSPIYLPALLDNPNNPDVQIRLEFFELTELHFFN